MPQHFATFGKTCIHRFCKYGGAFGATPPASSTPARCRRAVLQDGGIFYATLRLSKSSVWIQLVAVSNSLLSIFASKKQRPTHTDATKAHDEQQHHTTEYWQRLCWWQWVVGVLQRCFVAHGLRYCGACTKCTGRCMMSFASSTDKMKKVHVCHVCLFGTVFCFGTSCIVYRSAPLERYIRSAANVP